MSCLLQDDRGLYSHVIRQLPVISRHALRSVVTVSLSFYMYVFAFTLFQYQHEYIICRNIWDGYTLQWTHGHLQTTGHLWPGLYTLSMEVRCCPSSLTLLKCLRYVTCIPSFSVIVANICLSLTPVLQWPKHFKRCLCGSRSKKRLVLNFS